MKNFWKKINSPPHQRKTKNTSTKKGSFWCGGMPILALAPMAGITDSAFRQISKKYGADVTYSEMASATALFHKPAKTLKLVKFNKAERPYVVQLFGNSPEHFAVATQIITKKIKPDGIDINFGCPAKKVFGHGSGCALMGNIKLAREIISAVCENTNLPVSIKIRAGLKNISALDFIKKTKDLSYSAIMVHGRTYEGSFSGPVDFSICEKIKKIAPDKIVLGNGGINSAEDAADILKLYPLLDGLGIARGAWGKPFMFDEIKEIINSECRERIYAFQKKDHKFAVPTKKHKGYNLPKIKKIIIEHAKLIYKDKKELGMFEIRKHLCWYIRGFPGASDLRKKLVLAKSVAEIKEILK
jgi:tRNA-dihydrouridine synthase B